MGSNLLEALTRLFHNFTDEDAVVDGKKVYIMRPCMIHGPGNKGNLNLLYGVVSKGIPWPLGAFENRRSFTSIGNLQEVIKGLLTKDAPSGIYRRGDIHRRTDRGDMRCLGQEGADLAGAGGADALCFARG